VEGILKSQRVCVLLNGSSGTSKGEGRDKLEVALKAAFEDHAVSADLQFLTGKDLRAGAERALQRVAGGKLDAIIVGGGDGTISTVAGVLAGSGVPLGIIPLGTLNHFAKDLNIPLSLEEAVALITAGDLRSIDVGEINGRIFINNSSIGIYPYLVLDRERRTDRHGLPKWLAMILAGLRALRYFPLRRLTIQTTGGAEAYRSPCVFVGNNAYQISGQSLGTRRRLDEGLLSLFVAKQQSRLELLWLACRSVLGYLDQERDLRALTLTDVEISSGRRRLLVAFDGEVETMRSPLHYQVKPGALSVFAPSTTVA
jgi:diacylglycerol kinase family enzyme